MGKEANVELSQREKERRKLIWDERNRLLALTEAEAEAELLPIPDRYQRMRYQREIEAGEWLADIQRKLPSAPMPVLKSKYRSKKTKADYHQD
jgi:hypothetical protein